MVVVLGLLVRVIGRVADDDLHLALLLPPHPLYALVRRCGEKVVLVACLDVQVAHVIQRVHEAEVRDSAYWSATAANVAGCSGWRLSRAGWPLRWHEGLPYASDTACRVGRRR